MQKQRDRRNKVNTEKQWYGSKQRSKYNGTRPENGHKRKKEWHKETSEEKGSTNVKRITIEEAINRQPTPTIMGKKNQTYLRVEF